MLPHGFISCYHLLVDLKESVDIPLRDTLAINCLDDILTP